MVEEQKKIEELKQTYLSWRVHDDDVRYEGFQEGVSQKAIENARNLLAMNILTHEQIAQAIGLSLEKVNELAQSPSGHA